MKKAKILYLILACVLIGLAISGCAGGSVQDSGAKDETTRESAKSAFHIMELSAKALEEPVRGAQNGSAETVAGGANDFAFRLSAALASEVGTDNFVCSPFSVWLPLAALVNATQDRYKSDLIAALNAAGVNEADINNAASRMLYDLTRQQSVELDEEYNIEHHDPLKIANAIFVGNDYTLKRDFAQTFLDYYRGAAMSVDFSSPEAVEAVNRWASENTEGLIPGIIEEFDPETVAAIANAIYFSDRWGWEFDPADTAEDIFHSPTGVTSAFYMRQEHANQPYFEDDRVQAIPLGFRTEGGLYIILPKDGDASGLLASMTCGYLDEIQKDSVPATVRLMMPRFSIESGVMELRDTLTALGVPLFDDSTFPLTGGIIEEDLAVWLSSAVQKAIIEVDEKGTTAAAVTVMGAPGCGMPEPQEPVEMTCDKPFVFVLYGNTYDGGYQILFTGIVNRP